MRYFILALLALVGCTKSTLPQYDVLSNLRVVSLEIDHPEVDPGATVNLTALVSDYNGAGRALTYSVIACADPGVAFGADVTCDGRSDRTVVVDGAALTGLAARNYTGTAPTASLTVPATILDGRGTVEKFNGVAYLVFFVVRAVDGSSVTSFKRVIVSNNPTKNNNPTIDKVLADGTALAALPTKAVNLRASIPAASAEAFTRLAPDGSPVTDTESLVVSWFVTAGPLDREQTGVAQDNLWTPPSAAPAGQNVVVIAVVRDQRGGETHFVLAL